MEYPTAFLGLCSSRSWVPLVTNFNPFFYNFNVTLRVVYPFLERLGNLTD